MTRSKSSAGGLHRLIAGKAPATLAEAAIRQFDQHFANRFAVFTVKHSHEPLLHVNVCNREKALTSEFYGDG
jgi:hypothetical protein